LSLSACYPESSRLIIIDFCRALKTGGVEVSREKWDEAEAEGTTMAASTDDIDMNEPSSAAAALQQQQQRVIRSVLPDWTRAPLPPGAPPANRPAPSVPPTTVVGA
jgi:actin-related protein 10